MNPYSEESLGALRNILTCYNKFKTGSWKKTSADIGVAQENTLRLFANGSTLPDMAILAKVYAHFQSLSIKHAMWKQSWANQCQSDLERHFHRPGNIDPFRLFKQLEHVSEDELKRTASDLKGDYFLIRPHIKGGILMSHLRIYNSFKSIGLPICKISRAGRESGSKAIERDLIITGGIFKKSRTVNILGYGALDGEVGMISLKDVGEGGYRGFATGFSTSNSTLSSKVVVQRLNKLTKYDKVREKTGLWPDRNALEYFLADIFGKDHRFVERCRHLGSNDYLAWDVT